MKLRSAVLLAALAMLAAPARAAEPSPRPNIIVLLTDDHRWDALGCMGHPILRTPNLDRLAAGGALFTNNFCTTAICSVSRATLLSGQHARRHGIHDFAAGFSPAALADTYPLLLRRAGYWIGFIGKWGVGNELPEAEFDFFKGFAGQGQYFPDPNDPEAHLTRIQGDQAAEFLRAAPKDRPFCLSISFKAPHVQDGDLVQPFRFDPRHAAMYEDAEIPRAATATEADFARQPDFIRESEGRTRWGLRFADPEMFDRSVKGYYRLIAGVDETVGRILAELERAGTAANTVILFTSDNGYFLGEHGLEGKWLMHEESIRTPLIIFDPRSSDSQRGIKRGEMTLSIDLAPTVLDLAGVPAPARMQGRSLMPLARGENPPWRESFYYQHLFDFGGKIPASEGVRTPRRKYIRYLSPLPGYEQFFDLAADPLEQRDLMRSPAPPAELAGLKAELERLRREAE